MTAETAWAEAVARQFERRRVKFETPGDLAQALDPRLTQTPMLDLVDEAVMEVVRSARSGARSDRGPRRIICTPPQEGKSQRVTRRSPLWALLQDPDLRIAIVSYETTTAERWARAIRDDILANPQLGLRVSPTKATQREWELEGHRGGVYAVGVGGALTGRPVDLLIIDDPVKDREDADSPTMRAKLWDWFNDVALTRLAPGAPVFVIMTRWHPDDLAGRLIETGEWEVTSVPAQCEDPATDPLRRKAGEFLLSARGRTTGQWEALKSSLPARTWAALYQQRPVPSEGLIFHEHWIDAARRVTGAGEANWVRRLVAVDPAASSRESSDETGVVVLALDGDGHAWVLDDRSVRGTPQQWGTAVWEAVLDWGADEVVVEDNQGGEMVAHVLNTTWAAVNHLRAGTALRPTITRVWARHNKRVRAEAVAALYEQGRVHHADDGTGRLEALERQMTSWTGTSVDRSPDRMDALVHGLTALSQPRSAAASARRTRTRTR